jgi:hypothetical protein
MLRSDRQLAAKTDRLGRNASPPTKQSTCLLPAQPMAWSMSYVVGVACNTVTPWRSIKSRNANGSFCVPWSAYTSVPPHTSGRYISSTEMSKHTVARPRTRVCGPAWSSSRNHRICDVTPACLIITPLGLPVEPDVYSTYIKPPCSRAATLARATRSTACSSTSGPTGGTPTARATTLPCLPCTVMAAASSTNVGGTLTPNATAWSRHAALVSRQWHCAWSKMYVCRSGGNAGSTGTYAAPAFKHPRMPTTRATPRVTITPINGVSSTAPRHATATFSPTAFARSFNTRYE